MGSQRPGQIRFEAWLPADTYRALQAKVGNRKAWLLAQAQQELARESAQEHPNGDAPTHA
jgi:hypothetical protein